jgi:hypothetical protein
VQNRLNQIAVVKLDEGFGSGRVVDTIMHPDISEAIARGLPEPPTAARTTRRPMAYPRTLLFPPWHACATPERAGP